MSVERIKGWLERNPQGGPEPIHPDDLRALLAARAEAQDEGAAGERERIARHALGRIYLGHAQTPKETARLALDEMDAAHPSPPPAADEDRVRIACETARDALKCEGPEHELIYQRDRSALDRIATGPNLQRAIAAALKSEAK